jgi:hypothetical protein
VLPLPAERSHPHHRYPQADPSAHDQEFRDWWRRNHRIRQE